VQDAARRARQKDVDLTDTLVDDAKIAKALTVKEVHIAMDPNHYLGAAVEIVERIMKKYG